MTELPSNWVTTKLGEICQVIRGITFPASAKQQKYSPLNLCCLRTANIQREVDWQDVYFISKEYIDLEDQVVRIGDILISMANSYELVGKVAIVRDLPYETTFGAFISAIRTYTEIDNRYLFHLLRTDLIQKEFRKGSSQTVNIANISLKTISEINIPLAPNNEQKRIADKLDSLLAQVDNCRAHLDHVSQIIKRFRQAVLFIATNGQLTEDWRKKYGLETEEDQVGTKSFDFLDTDCFGSYQFPASWGIHRLGEIANITGGITKDSKKQNPSDEEVPYLRVANVQRGFLDLNEVKTIRVPAYRIEELRLQPGDILFNEGGDLDKLGRGWIWSGEIEPCVFQNHVFRARLKDERYSPKFFSFYGNSRGYDYFLSYGKQTTNLASINKSLLEALPVVVPHPDEQHEIVRRIEVLFAHADQLEARYRSAKELVESLPDVILGKAFRGELVPQDPNDEPAAVLLERIKMERAKQAQLPKPDRKVTKPRETKMTESELKEIIQKLPKDTFSFDDLRERIPGDYEQIKRLLFSVLSETDAIIKQVFDPNAEAIRFIRRER